MNPIKTAFLLVAAVSAGGASFDQPCKSCFPAIEWCPQRSATPEASKSLLADQLFDLNQGFWDNFIFPNNQRQMASINSTLFAPSVQGRVDSTRTFSGQELNTEYVFGSFRSPSESGTKINFLGSPVAHRTLQFATNSNLISVKELVLFNISRIKDLVPVQVDAWFSYNNEGQIVAYDATFRRFDWITDIIFDTLTQQITDKPDVEARSTIVTQMAAQICDTVQRHCTDQLKQFENRTACQDFLTQEIRFGKSYELGRNTLLCRSLHEALVPLRPEVHCAHIGPSGGGMCADNFRYSDAALATLM